MKSKCVILGFVLSCLGSLYASQAAAAAPNPFKKECAAKTKAKFAVAYWRGDSGSCLLDGTAFGPSKNLAAFSHPSTGVYCFTPSKASGLLKPEVRGASYPTVQVEWGSSAGSDLLAHVLRGTLGCPAEAIEVRTYKLPGGVATLSDDVSFYLKVD
jgi:hypothetical protein